jgi:membrane fusion protein (multidrug efflux system)
MLEEKMIGGEVRVWRATPTLVLRRPLQTRYFMRTTPRKIDALEAEPVTVVATLSHRPAGLDLPTHHTISPNEPSSMFRGEALDELLRGRVQGDVLRLSPSWIGWAYWILLATVLATLTFAAVGRVREHAPGPAVVRFGGRVDLTATSPGTVVSVEVRAGERVKRGQLLVRFHGADEVHTLERIKSELEMELVRSLSDPGDDASRKGLARLSAEKGLAEARLDDRSLRAPRAGTVSEIRIRPGQLLQAGDLALTLLDDETPPSLVAILPGHFRPQLHPGALLRFAPDGYPFSYQTLAIATVQDEVLGPSEVRRYLGPELADTVRIDGPSVIVTASLPNDRFSADGKPYRYHHGLPGRVWVSVRTRSILTAFIPALAGLLENERGAR